MSFLSDLVAVILGFVFLSIGFAYFTAEPNVKEYCQNSTNNPINSTSCIIRTTVQSW